MMGMKSKNEVTEVGCLMYLNFIFAFRDQTRDIKKIVRCNLTMLARLGEETGVIYLERWRQR